MFFSPVEVGISIGYTSNTTSKNRMKLIPPILNTTLKPALALDIFSFGAISILCGIMLGGWDYKGIAGIAVSQVTRLAKST